MSDVEISDPWNAFDAVRDRTDPDKVYIRVKNQLRSHDGREWVISPDLQRPEEIDGMVAELIGEIRAAGAHAKRLLTHQ